MVLADVLDEDGRQAAKETGATYAHLDVTSEDEWDALIAEVIGTHGRLDVMVNNAGIFRRGQLVDLTLETGVFLGMRAAGKAMIAAGNGGSIINISSVAGLQGTFGSMAYSASKWAVRGMTKVAAKEFGRYGIRVNSIHPGFVATDMTANMPVMLDDEKNRRMLKSVPLGRVGTADDIARVAHFLVSDASGYCTGQEFVVDGGVHG